MTQRLGSASEIDLYPETAFDDDTGITKGYKVPITAAETFAPTQNRVEVPIYKGNRKPLTTLKGIATATGGLPLLLDSIFFARLCKLFLGGYTRVNTLHKFVIGTPGSFQLVKRSTESPEIVLRSKGVHGNTLAFTSDVQGPVRYSLDCIGCGDEVKTDVAGPPTLTDDDVTGFSYFDGLCLLDGVEQATLSTWNLSLLNNTQRQDTLFSDGIGGINPGRVSGTGRLEMLFEDLTLWDDAVAESLLTLETWFADGNPKTGTVTQWIRLLLTAIRLGKESFKSGGDAGLIVGANFALEGNVDWAAEIMGPTQGPYNIDATHNTLGFKVDGSSVAPVTLTQGATRTSAQVVADINTAAISELGTARDVLQRPIVPTAAAGSTHHIEIDTGVSNSAHTLFGWDGTEDIYGYTNEPVIVDCFNTIDAAIL
jgi:Phage tail tube protein